MEDNNPEHQEIPERLRIQDLEGWLQYNGLSAPDEEPNNVDVRLEEEKAIYEEFSHYQQSMHEQIFADTKEEERKKEEGRRAILDSLKEAEIDFCTADGVVSGLPLQPLAESCDTIFALASSWERFSSEDRKIQFSLEHFPESSVNEFLQVVLSKKEVDSISADAIVDCCQIAHYVQNTEVLDATVEILLHSIDTANCLSLCQLADQLNLPTLFERALAHMMDTIGELEDNEACDHLTPELQDRINAIKTAIQSSINSRSRLYFSSLEEYIAIIGERVQYYKERLAEAKEQQERERYGTHAWRDAQTKIENQERRVRTLEIALKEQKKLFTSSRSR